MSRLRIVARSSIVVGFQLAGAEAFVADTAHAAQQMIDRWIQAGETGLLAIDERLVAGFDEHFQRRLDTNDTLLYLVLPCGEPLPPEISSQARIADLIRRAIGFHITFQGE